MSHPEWRNQGSIKAVEPTWNVARFFKIKHQNGLRIDWDVSTVYITEQGVLSGVHAI
jgi:hypothetical protein